MEHAEHYKLFSEPWRLISNDIDITIAKEYMQRLCYDKGQCSMSPVEVFEELRTTLGDFRLNSLAVDLANITQQRFMAVDAALARLEREKLHLKSLEPKAKNDASDTQFGHIVKDLFATILCDNDNAVGLKHLSEFSSEECEYRIMCLTFKLLSIYSQTLPENHALRSFNIKTNTAPIRADAIFKLFLKPDPLPDGTDASSLAYLLHKGDLEHGIYSKRDSILLCWQSLQTSDAALNFRNSVYSAAKSLISTTTETNRELAACIDTYETLLQLKEQASSYFMEDTTVTISGRDELISINLAEIQDHLCDDVALVMSIVDNEDKTYAVCECVYDAHVKDPMNKEYWQPADDMLYLRYIEKREPTVQPQQYTLIRPVEFGDIRGSMLRPIRCKHCGRLMLPTSRFLLKLSIAADTKQITSGGQFTSTTVDRTQGVVMMHTAEAIKLKMDDIQRLTSNCVGLGFIDWPSAMTLGSKQTIECTNVFSSTIYKSYFEHLSKSLSSTTSAQTTSTLIDDVAVILKANKNAGYTIADYLYSLILALNDDNYSLQKFITCSRVLYGTEVEIANIEQAISVLNSEIYDTNIYGKLDMPFGYPNIKSLLKTIVSVPQMLRSLEYDSVEAMLSAITCTSTKYTINECNVDTCNLLPRSIVDESGEEQEHIPDKQELLCNLKLLKLFYSDLRDAAKNERNEFIHALTNAPDIFEFVSITNTTTMEALSSSELALLEDSAGISDFWSVIDKSKYNNLIHRIADSLRDKGVIASTATTSIATTQVTREYLTYAEMLCKLHASAFQYICIEDGNDWPDMSCLHQRIFGDPADIYHKMLALYTREYNLAVEDSSFSAEDVAEFAVKIYYECIVSDSISDSIRAHIKDFVSDAAYLSFGGFDE